MTEALGDDNTSTSTSRLDGLIDTESLLNDAPYYNDKNSFLSSETILLDSHQSNQSAAA